ncbi:putative transcription factor C2H2 family [Helianthus debilis subsp. tardiflorus]
MGHRHVLSPSYMLETDNDQRWNLIERPCAVTAESDAAESSSLAYPENNMSSDGEQCSNPAPVSNAYSSLAHNAQNLNYQQDTSGPSDLPTGHENYENIASSSNYNGHANNDDDNGRWQYKRKSPADTVTNRYNNSSTSSSTDNNNNNNNSNDGSSPEICIPTDPWEEAQNMRIIRTPWGYPNVKRSHEGESSVRNVRSRVAPSNDYYSTSRFMDVSSSGSMREWNSTHVSSSLQTHELNPFLVGGSSDSENGIITRSNHAQSTQVQSDRGTRSYYIQRSSNLQLGHSDEGLQLATESYFSPRVRPAIAWRSSDRNARARITIGRYQSFSEEANFHDQPVPEGLMIVDRSAFGSRNPFDHHQDMRLDIDDMSYEELLALGERIGSVSTGLSENQISKCLRESIYCSSDQLQEEGTCVICLEEYANMDDVGMLKGCKHDFHVGCIKKWLSMKNLCPICKSEPIKQK